MRRLVDVVRDAFRAEAGGTDAATGEPMNAIATTEISGQLSGWPDAGTTTKQTKEHKMKTVKHNIIGTGIAMAMAIAAWLPTSIQAQEKGTAKGGAQQLLRSTPVRTLEDLSGIQPGDMMVMSCPKCKTVTINYVEPTFKAMETKGKVRTQHMCPGCNTTIMVEGHGKAKKAVVKHVCMSCGSKDAFCCVMKKGADPTKGMEKEKK